MAEKETFFGQLRDLARCLDRGVAEVKRAVDSRPDSDSDNHSVANRILLDASTEARALRGRMLEELVALQKSTSHTEQVAGLAMRVVARQMAKLSHLEDYLCQYGYVQPEVIQDKEENKQETEQQEKMKDENSEGKDAVLCCSTPSPKVASSTVCRTPRLEDFGISSQSLALLQKQTARLAVSEPSFLDNSCVLVTPSLFNSSNWTKRSPGPGPGIRLRQGDYPPPSKPRFDEELAACTESPIPPVLATPGVKQIEKKWYDALPTLHLPPTPMGQRACRSPEPPVLMTPGVRQIQKMTDLPPPSPLPSRVAATTTHTHTPSPPLLQSLGVKQIQKASLRPVPNLAQVASASTSKDTPSPPVFCTPGIKQINKRWQPPVEPTPPRQTARGAAASPIPPVFATPGVRQIHDTLESVNAQLTLEEETEECSFALQPPHTPRPPILNTPGVRQIKHTLAHVNARLREEEEEVTAECTFPLKPLRTPPPPTLMTPGVKQIVQSQGNGDAQAACKSQLRELTPVMHSNSNKLWADTPEPPTMTFSLEELKSLSRSLKHPADFSAGSIST